MTPYTYTYFGPLITLYSHLPLKSKHIPNPVHGSFVTMTIHNHLLIRPLLYRPIQTSTYNSKNRTHDPESLTLLIISIVQRLINNLSMEIPQTKVKQQINLRKQPRHQKDPYKYVPTRLPYLLVLFALVLYIHVLTQ